MTSHLFTQMGLGQAPFKIVGYTEKSTGCAYCGRPIKRVSIVLSSDGVKSNIGCECIKKVGDSSLISAEKVAIRKYKAKVKYDKQMEQYYDVMYEKWANHPYINKNLESDKEAFLKDMERVMKEVVNESKS